ncbi:hypothetical protein F4809DRAFT_518087 [Biscogniauxia mediterranea]|nr:hypothetical protein F4809DRAFT_518087 [Biscogniauxia mediterranea]
MIHASLFPLTLPTLARSSGIIRIVEVPELSDFFSFLLSFFLKRERETDTVCLCVCVWVDEWVEARKKETTHYTLSGQTSRFPSMRFADYRRGGLGRVAARESFHSFEKHSNASATRVDTACLADQPCRLSLALGCYLWQVTIAYLPSHQCPIIYGFTSA